MSIANLVSSEIPLINVNEIDSQRIFTEHIDANPSFGNTLYLGTEPQTQAIQIDSPGGNGATVASHLVCKDYQRGSSLGAGTVDIHTDVSTQAINLGHTGCSVQIRANSLILPSIPGTTTPYAFDQSGVYQFFTLSYTGASNTSNAVNFSYRRIGNWVDICMRQTLSSTITATGPLILAGALTTNYRPTTSARDFACNVYNNAGNSLDYVSGNLRIQTNGDVYIYTQNGGNFTMGAGSGINSIAVSFDVDH